MGFSNMRGVDAYGFLRNRHAMALAVVDGLVDQASLKRFAEQYAGLDDAPRKLRAALYSVAARFTETSAKVLAACQAYRANGVDAGAFVALNPFASFAWRRVSGGIANHCPAPGWAMGAFIQLGGRVVRRLWARARRAMSAPGVPVSQASAPAPEFARPDEAEVLFFPHQGVGFGALFRKDQFYSDDPASPLFKSNILHVELAGRMSRETLDAVLQDYAAWGLKVRTLVRSADGWRNVKEFARFGFKENRFWKLSGPVKGAALLFVVRYLYEGWRQGLVPYAGAKIALVGYDYLFPQTLAMALQARGVRVVASQERFIQSFYPNIALILDEYCVCGQVVKERLEQNDLCAIGHVSLTGNVRNDLIQKGGDGQGTGRQVVVFDFHSDPHEEKGEKNPVINWHSNREFYEDILRLGAKYPEVQFIIRGKDANWLEIPYFSGVRDRILAAENIEVDQNYEQLNRSYALAARADAVIARHTSIGDELLAVGTPVIFHDYAPNCPGIVSSIFNYEDFPVFVHDFETLDNRLQHALEGRYMDAPQWAGLRNRFYTDSFDGKVRQRIRSVIEGLISTTRDGAEDE